MERDERGPWWAACALVLLLAVAMPAHARQLTQLSSPDGIMVPTNLSEVPPAMLGGQFTPSYIDVPGVTPPQPEAPPEEVAAYFPPVPDVSPVVDAADGAASKDSPMMSAITGLVGMVSEFPEPEPTPTHAPAPDEASESAGVGHGVVGVLVILSALTVVATVISRPVRHRKEHVPRTGVNYGAMTVETPLESAPLQGNS